MKHLHQEVRIAYIFLIFTLILGIGYYIGAERFNGKAPKVESFIPYEEQSVELINGQKKKELHIVNDVGEEIINNVQCEPAVNPDLVNQYAQLKGEDCGYLRDDENIKKVSSCIKSGLNRCLQTKTYIQRETMGGPIQFLVTTNTDCSMKVTRWSEIQPFCGISIQECKELSPDFPLEMCKE